MNHPDLELLTRAVCQLAKTVSVYIKNQVETVAVSDIREKGNHDFVTHVDQNAEKMLIEGLSKLLPESGFLAEENTANTDEQEFMWIIDPLDGTTNFIHQVPLYSISIALNQFGETILGVVHEVNLNETFYSWLGGSVYLNESIQKVSQVTDMNHSLLATGFPYQDYTKLFPYMQVFEHFMFKSSGLRRLGSAAVDLAYVACGRFEGFYEYGLQPWDVAAGAFLVKQAGGIVSDFSGKNDYLYGKEIVASNPFIYKKMMQVIQEYLR